MRLTKGELYIEINEEELTVKSNLPGFKKIWDSTVEASEDLFEPHGGSPTRIVLNACLANWDQEWIVSEEQDQNLIY